jgi:DNA polymerase elongation subunit (family B)
MSEGYLFDAYAEGCRIAVWIWSEGRVQKFYDTFEPCFYAIPEKRMIALLKRHHVRMRLIMKKDFIDQNEIRVLAIMPGIARFFSVVKMVEEYGNYAYELYNADIPLEQMYFFEKNVQPLCSLQYSFQEKNGVSWLTSLTSTDAKNPAPMLPFKILQISAEFTDDIRKGVAVPLKNIRYNSTLITGTEQDILTAFATAYNTADPDLVLVDDGDRLLPHLDFRFRQHGLSLTFGRDPDTFFRRDSRSYFSYGRVLFKPSAVLLRGRLHIDTSTFLYREGGFPGIVELAKTCCVTIQRTARNSPGSGINNLQVKHAYPDYLIPYKKNQTEHYKTGNELFFADRGGVIFEPAGGFHEDVAELDFVSMYPSIMVRENISPETISCSCCTENALETASNIKTSPTPHPPPPPSAVSNELDAQQCGSRHVAEPRQGVAPFGDVAEGKSNEVWANAQTREKPKVSTVVRLAVEACSGVMCGKISTKNEESIRQLPLGAHLTCRKRQGLIPKILAPIIERRRQYKALGTPEAKQRATALKWILVTCFGYLGFRHAKFGRIEAHEAINAHSRETLLLAMRIAEECGFRVLHGIIDSLWVHKKDMTTQEITCLAENIAQQTRLPISVEGRYRWIVFLSSVAHEQITVPSRFYGVFFDGTLKCRGIELRRRDAPRIVTTLQDAQLAVLKGARTLQDFEQGITRSIALLKTALRCIRDSAGDDLRITKHLSKTTYNVACAQKTVTEKLSNECIFLQPGERIRYVLRDVHARRSEERFGLDAERIDVDAYRDLLIRATATLFSPFGLTRERLYKLVTHECQLTLQDCRVSWTSHLFHLRTVQESLMQYANT